MTTSETSKEPPIHNNRNSNDGLEIGIFWDYETIGNEFQNRLIDMMKSIESTINIYGKIVEKKFYYNSTKFPSPYSFNNSSNFSLIDCPSSGNKKSLDKKILVDALGFAWERILQKTSACVVLVSADEDFSYALTKLRNLGVKTILIHGHLQDVSDILLDCCDISLSLHEISNDSFDVFDNVSDCDSVCSTEDDESLLGELIEVDDDPVIENLPTPIISPSNLLSINSQEKEWSLSHDDPILIESNPSPFETESSYSLFSPFKSFSDFSPLDNRSYDQLQQQQTQTQQQYSSSTVGTYNLWQSKPSNDLFYLLHNSCFPSSG